MPSDPQQPRYQFSEKNKRTLTAFHELLCTPPAQLVKNCINCDLFDEPNELCRKHQRRPPARIIAHSCPDWENLSDEIPF